MDDFIDAENLSLDEWLSYILKPSSKFFILDYEFPTQKHADEFISTINQRTDDEIKKILLNFLIPSISLGTDKLVLQCFLHTKKYNPDAFLNLKKTQFFRRLVSFAFKKSIIPPWEGITWIVDLLPDNPKQALEVLDGYITTHISFLAEGRIRGLSEAAEIIRAKYIGTPVNQGEKVKFLQTEIKPRQFEHIVERLYYKMGYQTELTPAQKDGGRDVIIKKTQPGNSERSLIECKQYSKPVGVEIVRALLGVVSHEKVNKGILVTTNKFTKGAINLANENPRLELISGDSLIPLLNEYLGAQWWNKIEGIIIDSQKQKQKMNVV